MVDTARAYDFSQWGTYTATFLTPRIARVARAEAEMAQTLDSDPQRAAEAPGAIEGGRTVMIHEDGVVALIEPLLFRFRRGDHAQLLHHAHDVGIFPPFRQLAAGNPGKGHAGY